MKGTIENVQTLRGVAALSVVYLHTTSIAGFNLWPSVGNFGVDIFFVISGFIIAYMTALDPRYFMLKRIIRIVPFYWSATFAVFALALIAPHLLRSTEANVPLLIHSLFFIPYVHGQNSTQPMLLLGWTLNYEMYFYLAFWAATKLNRQFRTLIACGLMVGVFGLVHLSGTTSKAILFYGDPIIFEFMFGVIVFHLFDLSAKAGPALRSRMWIAFALLGVAVAGYVVCAMDEAKYTIIDPTLAGRALSLGVPAFFVVASMVVTERIWGLKVTGHVLRELGDASYILYLIHPYIVFGLTRVLLKRFPIQSEGLRWVLVALLLVLTSAIAIAIYNYLEKPALKILRARLIPRLPRPAS